MTFVLWIRKSDEPDYMETFHNEYYDIKIAKAMEAGLKEAGYITRLAKIDLRAKPDFISTISI